MTEFPTDPLTVHMLRKACDTSLSVSEDGEHTPVNGEFTLYQFLDFMSEYDSSNSVEVSPGVYEYQGPPVFSPQDVIRALADEVIRLRILLDAHE